MTQERALRHLFNQKNLTDYMRLQKHMFKNGTLTENVKEKLLTEAGYKKKKDSVWSKQK